MNDRILQAMATVSYLLTPDVSSGHLEGRLMDTVHGAGASNRWLGAFKAGVWIFLSIGAALALGQLK